MSIVLAVYAVLMVLVIIVMVRNGMVFRYRGRMLAEISKAAKVDIYENRDWQKRYDAFDAVEYDEMVIKFWKPLDSFYPNRDAITK